ncbi:class I SAM-dependent methyltransferase family protein [Candidatus Micrarchaeota archaeon]|nr:class I SAM-dependent methyltransferase family protein [Candidatus Micrarchaeota archaeon]
MQYGGLKQILAGKLKPRELEHVTRSFDVIGSIAVVEVRPEVQKHEGLIADAIMKLNPNVRTVCARAGKHEGEFRVRRVRVIAGKKTTKTVYVESGVRMEVDLNKCYFSPRLGHERSRIARQVRAGERVAVFFAGIGPYALVIARAQPKVVVYAMELNTRAFDYMRRNVLLNNMSDRVFPISGDCQHAVELLPEKVDRVVMPLPWRASEFLDAALAVARRGAMIHYYAFGPITDPYRKALSGVRDACEKNNRAFAVLEKRVVRPYSPREHQVVIDFKLIK